MSKHALLSASGAKRWMTCTPSARVEEKIKDEGGSVYAEEGTFAHAYSELILQKALGILSQKQFTPKQKKLQQNSFYSPSLEEYVQSYTTIVLERFSGAKAKDPNAVMQLEQRLDFSQWVPDGFGTGDVVIISDGTLEIIDLKYGAGIPVSARDNPQLGLYALGSLVAFECLYDIDKVVMTIIQPRLDNISSSEIDVETLYQWAEGEVKPKADLAHAGDGEFVPGDHCRFCKAKATCRKRAEGNLELAQHDFKKSNLLTDEEIVDILSKVDELQAWAKDVAEFAYNQALNRGKKWSGWKLVEGKSNRTYTNRDEVATKLLADGFAEDKIFEKSLLGITAMEKLLGKKAFELALSEFIIKPVGKPTLALETDKRPEINSVQAAVADFEDDMLG